MGTGASWDRIRQTFADQFEQDGTGFIYRKSQKGEAIRVSAEERNRFSVEFDRGIRRAKWIIYVGMAGSLACVILISLLNGTHLPHGAVIAGIVIAMIPYLAYIRWIWGFPARALAGRTPVAGERSREEVRRLVFKRMTYGQLATAAAGGLLMPLIASSHHQRVLAGWNLVWVIFGGGLVLLATVQALRKWQVEREDASRDLISRPFGSVVAQPMRRSTSNAVAQVWRYVPLVVVALLLASIAFIPAGKRFAQAPSVWSLVMIGSAGWALFTVVQGFRKGQIEPFVRGFYNSYERESQPRRFWASMVWNTLFGVLCLSLSLSLTQHTRPDEVTNDCYASTARPARVIAACSDLIKQDPNNFGATFNRGLAYLNSFKFDEAITDFTKAHDLRPKSEWPLADRGMAYAWKNDRARAERDFAFVRTIDPANPVVLHGEGMLSMNDGDLETAVEDFSKALKINSRDAWALQMRADAYQQRGDFDHAKDDRERLQQMANTATVPPSSHS